MPAPWYRWEGRDLILELQGQPRASRDRVAGPQGDRLKVCIGAPPVDGEANTRLIAFLAKLCGVPRRDVEVLRGHTGRRKTVRLRAPGRLPPGVDAPPCEPRHNRPGV